jgi:hypothetical protein
MWLERREQKEDQEATLQQSAFSFARHAALAESYMNRRRALAWIGSTAIVAAVAVLGIEQVIVASVDEYYSPGMHSGSRDDARERGVLIASVAVADSFLRWKEREYRIKEAWIEDEKQVYYRWIFFQHDSLLHRPTLIVRIEDSIATQPRAEPLCVALGSAALVVNGSIRLHGNDCQRWLGFVEPPYPTSATVRVRQAAAVPATN